MDTLKAEIRKEVGKKTEELRSRGFIPAELYGNRVTNIHLSVNSKEFLKVFKEAGENTIINLDIEGAVKPVLVHHLDRHHLDESITHIDFYQVNMSEKIKAHVPVKFTGEAPAVKEKGGVLNKSLSEIEVESLPSDLPHSFEIDLSALDDINKSVHVKDVKVPKNVKIMLEPETVIATILPKAEGEISAPAAEVSEVQVETELKKAERDKESKEKEEAGS